MVNLFCAVPNLELSITDKKTLNYFDVFVIELKSIKIRIFR